MSTTEQTVPTYSRLYALLVTQKATPENLRARQNFKEALDPASKVVMRAVHSNKGVCPDGYGYPTLFKDGMTSVVLKATARKVSVWVMLPCRSGEDECEMVQLVSPMWKSHLKGGANYGWAHSFAQTAVERYRR